MGLVCLLVPGVAPGQSSNATLGGTVSDATGALIPGVTITATNTATGIVSSVVSNEAGAYNFASLQTGTYRVSAELPGFQTQTYNEVNLGIAQQVRLNFALQVGAVAQAVEVTVAADTLIATTSASVGTVLAEQRVRDLPLRGRDVLDLLRATSGAGPMVATTRADEAKQGYFAGGRLSAVNTTRDGFVVSDGRYDHGAFSATYVSPDLVEEVRVITAPVDAEAGRGAGQVQMVTRSGTNQFRGSIFWTNRNSALDASNWFNNFNRVTKDYENRNQFGGRIGGPIIRNKTFFFFLVEEQRYINKQTFVGNVLTGPARQGIFRFYPGADNANATAIRPTVDFNGNPVRPANATGDLQQFTVFNRDPFRPGFDPSGFIQNTLLARMPMPNDYTIGDGLNTAGIRFLRRVSGLDQPDGNETDRTNRDQFNARIDHQFNVNQKASVVYTWERDINNSAQSGIMQWPGGYNGASHRYPRVLNGSLVSTLSPSVVNEFRAGYMRTKQYSWVPFYVGRFNDGEPNEKGKEALALLPVKNGYPFAPVTTLFAQNIMNWTSNNGNTRWSDSPRYTIGDSISWNKGAHAFKVGIEWRHGSSYSGNDTNFTPLATLGAGGAPVQGIDNVAIPGLTGNNQTLARNLLTDLSGSVDRIQQGFDIRDPKNPAFAGYTDGVTMRLRDWHGTELSWFFKDTWKASPSLTLNYGIHWEWYGTPYEKTGRAGAPIGGSDGLCGISCGSLTRTQFVGKNSPNPDVLLYNNDFNNFAPSFGLSWSIPWLGQDKTVLRMGYGWSIAGGPLKATSSGLNGIAGATPGTFGGTASGGGDGLIYTQAGYMSIANLSLPIPIPFAPLQPVPIESPREQSVQTYDRNRRDPYIQNFNFEIQRELARDFSVSVAYVGTKGTRLWGGIPLNAVNIHAAAGGQSFLDAFNLTRAGGNAALFDQMLRGLNIPGAGVVNGTTVTGSAALRAYTATRANIANGNVGQLADFLNRSTNVTGRGGGFVRNGGLPENFFVLNPQFQNSNLYSNPGSSTYHALQVQLTKRLSYGFTSQASYTWSRSLGESDGDGLLNYRDPNNRSLNKQLLGFHRTQSFTTNGMYELPFGPGRRFLADTPGFVQRLVERWQFSGIFSWAPGAPLTVGAPVSTIWQQTTFMTPNVVGDFGKDAGKVTKLSNGVTLFPGIQQVTDPAAGGVSSANALSGSFSNKAIADSQGKLLLVNPAPGQVGSLGLTWVQGPPAMGFDVNLIKRVRMTETSEFELRVDAVNVLNKPMFLPPTSANMSINSTSFGRITAAGGNRRFVVNARVSF
jgi:hypothetical protein